MNIITFNVERYGYIYITAAAFDAALNRFLPASLRQLREVCEERSGLEYMSSITEVSVFIAMLADWEYNVDGSPLAVRMSDGWSEDPSLVFRWQNEVRGLVGMISDDYDWLIVDATTDETVSRGSARDLAHAKLAVHHAMRKIA